ncbi:MAG: FkbM family methyltransferase [Kofleriaceae bacterium]
MRQRVIEQLRRLRDVLPGGQGRVSFSQEGEDLILARMFEERPTGFYVDVGAHHPLRFSNTQLLYRRGWRGVNIDASPGSMAAFREHRPRDLNLELGITPVAGTHEFYVFDEPALNTFDSARVKELAATPYKLVRTVPVKCMPLSEVLAEHHIDQIDLLTIDAEGYDFAILQTVAWEIARPRVVVTEQFSRDLEELVTTPLHGYMRERGYRLAAKTFNSLFYAAT